MKIYIEYTNRKKGEKNIKLVEKFYYILLTLKLMCQKTKKTFPSI